MKKGLALFATHVSVCIAENESNGCEKVAFARTVTADDDIVLGGERLDDRLILVAVKRTPSH